MPTMQLSHPHVRPYHEWMVESAHPRPLHMEAWLSSELSSLECLRNAISNCPPKCRYPHMHGELLSLFLQQFQPTLAHPDLVLIEDLSINLLELTIPTNTYEVLQAARNRKSRNHYTSNWLVTWKACGLSVFFLTLEIGSLGHFTPYAVKCLTSYLRSVQTTC